MNEHHSAFERAAAGYDDEHEKALVAAIFHAINQASLISDPPVLCIRTGEIAHALETVLVATLALSPTATRSPKAIRELTDRLRKRLVKRVARAAADPATRDFLDRVFRSDDDQRGGSA
jgi:hypothetical protein